MRRKYRVVIAYDGTGYSGWQMQSNAVGVQQVVEEALAWLEGAPVRIYGSSRTDAGVHARGFVGHFHLTKPVPPKNVVRALNARLPDSVRVMGAAYAGEGFDARLSAKGMEWPVVIVPWLVEGMFPSGKAVEEGRLDEERRLFYVVVTRAKDSLYLFVPQVRKMADGGMFPVPPSMFVKEIPKELLSPLRFSFGYGGYGGGYRI